MRKGNQLNTEQRPFLVSQVTAKEIEVTLKDMWVLKAPGVDGYGVKFYKSCWPIIKEDFIAVVREFFTHRRIQNDFNKFFITIIPKSDQTLFVKDYRPRIITARLGSVLSGIVSLSQAAFVLGQIIHKHIMIAYDIIKGYTRKGGTPKLMHQLDLQKIYDMVS